MPPTIEGLKQQIRSNTAQFSADLDRARAVGVPDEVIYQGYRTHRNRHEALVQQLRDARANRRRELEQQAYSMPRLHGYTTVSAGAQELMAARDAVSRARTAADADELLAYMDAGLQLGDEVLCHTVWLEAQRRGNEEGDFASAVAGASGPYAEINQRYLSAYPTRANAVNELAAMGGLVNGEEPIADDVIDSMALVGPQEPEEAARYQEPPSNPFEQEPEPVAAGGGE